MTYWSRLFRPLISQTVCRRRNAPATNSNILQRFKSTLGANGTDEAARRLKLRSTLYYVTAAGVMFVGMTYAAVPLYRMFCQVRIFSFF